MLKTLQLLYSLWNYQKFIIIVRYWWIDFYFFLKILFRKHKFLKFMTKCFHIIIRLNINLKAC